MGGGSALPTPVSTGSAFANARRDPAIALRAQAGQVPRVSLNPVGIPLADFGNYTVANDRYR